MRRGDICWADLGPPAGRRPVLIVTRNAAIPVLAAVVVAPVTRTVRDIASEVRLGLDHGLPEEGVANCDNLLTVPKQRLDPEPVGELGAWKVMELDQALCFALEINF
ncbi:MAG TPA: type II toxin-antitoxin system PemK/MazF family toxin [Actinomycetota bacterium]|nr:type II toxin-antitoxin system PemK/MazF family toxin [Actinomycetota bacterium]